MPFANSSLPYTSFQAGFSKFEINCHGQVPATCPVHPALTDGACPLDYNSSVFFTIGPKFMSFITNMLGIMYFPATGMSAR